MRHLISIAVALWTVSVAAGMPLAATSTEAPAAAISAEAVHDKLNQYCVACHNTRLKTADLMLDTADVAQIGAHADIWEKVARKLRSGAMPPPGARRPDQATYDAMVQWLEASLDAAASAAPNPGRPAVHRLNRAEYANAVRDLLAVDIDAATLLPPDDSAKGFDNIADALGVSPSLLEGYLTAAAHVSALAVGDPAIG